MLPSPYTLVASWVAKGGLHMCATDQEQEIITCSQASLRLRYFLLHSLIQIEHRYSESH